MEGAKQPSIDACSSTCLVSRTCVADRIQANSEAGRPVARSPVRLSPFYFSNPSRDGPCAREKHSSRSIERIVTATRQGSTRKYRHIKKKRDSLSSSSSSAPPTLLLHPELPTQSLGEMSAEKQIDRRCQTTSCSSCCDENTKM